MSTLLPSDLAAKVTAATRQFPDLTISIISANNLALLLPCLSSVFSTPGLNLEVFVVDNASDDDTALAVETEFPQVRVIRNAQRLGFSTNNNLVLNQATGRYLMLLNDDTLVLDDALATMVRFLDGQPAAGAVGANLLNPDGTYQLAVSKFPSPVYEALFPAANRYGSHIFVANSPVAVDCVSGGALMIRREVFDSVGGLDTSFDPIYSEEIDWCYRIKQANWKIYMLPSARIIHYGGQTMNRTVPRKYELLLAHKTMFYRKHGGRTAAALYRAFLSMAVLAKLTWWFGVSLLPDQPPAAGEKAQLNSYLLQRIWTW